MTSLIARCSGAALLAAAVAWLGLAREAEAACNPPSTEDRKLMEFTVTHVASGRSVTATPLYNPKTLVICEGDDLKIKMTGLAVGTPTPNHVGWRIEKEDGDVHNLVDVYVPAPTPALPAVSRNQGNLGVVDCNPEVDLYPKDTDPSFRIFHIKAFCDDIGNCSLDDGDAYYEGGDPNTIIEIDVVVLKVEFIDAAENADTVDLVKVLNATPYVEITGPADGNVSDSITVNVVTKDPIAPIEESKISIDGQAPDTAGTPTWNASQKYFERTFSKTLTIGEFSRYIKVVATNAVGNVGSDSLTIKTLRKTDGLAIDSRKAINNPSPPDQPEAAADYEFRVEINNQAANANSGAKETISADFKALVTTTLDLEETDNNSGIFRSKWLVAVPKNFVKPTGFASSVQDIIDTRLAVELGTFPQVEYTIGGLICTDRALPLGILIVDESGTIVDSAIEPGNTSDETRLGVVVGHDGNDGATVSVSLESLDGLNATVANLGSDYPASTQSVDFNRQASDKANPSYNLYKLPAGRNVLPMNSKKKTTSHIQHYTRVGGFLVAKDGTLKSRERIAGKNVVVLAVDGMRSDGANAMLQKLAKDRKLPSVGELLGQRPDNTGEAPKGTILDFARAVYPTVTLVNWPAIFTGKTPNQTRVLGNEMIIRDYDPTANKIRHIVFCGGGFSKGFPPGDDANKIFAVNASEQQQGLVNDMLQGTIDPGASGGGFNLGAVVKSTYEDTATSKGLASAVVFSQVSKGVFDLATDWRKPTEDIGTASVAWNAFLEWVRGGGATLSSLLDEEARESSVDYLQKCNTGPAPRPFPSVMTAYFMGTDHYLHVNGEGLNNGNINGYLFEVLDKEVDTITAELKRQNVYDLTQFVIVSDHGHTPVKCDQNNVVSLVRDIFLWPLDDPELVEVFDECGYDVLKDAGEIGDPAQYSAVSALNGGMSHIYLRNRLTGQWTDAPRWEEDVLEVADKLRVNHHTGEPEGDLQNSIKAILIRNGFSADYQVYRLDGSLGSSATPLSTTDRLLNLQSLEDFFNVGANRPSLFGSGADAAAEINGNLKHKYSGDIIVLANGDPASADDRHAWQSGPEDSVHGFFNDKDFRGTMMGGCPGGDSTSVTQLQGAFSGKTKLRETHEIIKTLLGL